MTSGPADGSADRIKVAILGGGCGGLAAAWTLTSTPDLRARFEVTVYERGWRLGGKGASGRTPAGEAGQRIEEHGLHIWFGFYAHAFRLLRQAYEESGTATGDGWWRAAFLKCDAVSLYERRDDGSWARQAITIAARGGRDAGPPTEPTPAPFRRLLVDAMRGLATASRAELAREEPRHRDPGHRAASTLEALAARLEKLEKLHTVEAVERSVERLLGHVEELGGGEPIEDVDRTDRVRLWRGMLDLAAATLAGVVRDGLLFRELSAIDGEDLRDWLARHGASEHALERAPVLHALYDLTFAYLDGDKDRPSLAAGKGLSALLRMIDCEGAFMWRMRAGMGDVVFSPIYLALCRRGVRFRFFSRVDALRLAAGRPIIEAIELTRQATVRAGADAYDPLERIGAWSCWPDAPLADQLADAAPSRAETLRRGEDFDDVVLAIPAGALRPMCVELAATSPRFERMLAGARTVCTRAFQVWLTKPVSELSGMPPGRADALDPPATAYAEPFDTYCDMSHLLEVERYGHDGPRGIAYFCAVMPEPAGDSGSQDAVRAAARQHLEQNARAFWPGAFSGEEFDWGVLWDPLDRAGPERLQAQYFRANVEGSERYVTTPAGSVDRRLGPGESGFENLVLAGDWTHSEIDGGCVEAAVISGERAGEALIEAARRRQDGRGSARRLPGYVEFGALATAPGPLECERARIYCFFVRSDRARVQHLCDRVLGAPTGGALRYRVSVAAPVILTFGVLGGLHSVHPAHAGRGSAVEAEAAIWVPVVAQRWERGGYVGDHVAIFMPYIWVDDPVALASGREVYGFPKTYGWMTPLDDPPTSTSGASGEIPDPPPELCLDVYGAPHYAPGAVLGRRRLMTLRRPAGEDAARDRAPGGGARGTRLVELLHHLEIPHLADAAAWSRGFRELVIHHVVHHVFLKQIRDATDGERAALQQVVQARSSVTPSSLRWRRLTGPHELTIDPLDSQPLHEELGIECHQTISHAFAAEFGFRMEPGEVVWPRR